MSRLFDIGRCWLRWIFEGGVLRVSIALRLDAAVEAHVMAQLSARRRDWVGVSHYQFVASELMVEVSARRARLRALKAERPR